MPVYTRHTTLPVTPDVLYAWHARPGAFERLVPPWQAMEVLEQRGGFADREVTLRLRQAGLPFRWVARHRDVVEGSQFVDEQVSGPFRRWVHTHRFLPDPAGAVLEDSVEWEAPLGGVGAWLGDVEDTLERTFRFRHARTAADLARHAAWTGGPLTFAITGASGLVGTALAAFLGSGGHAVRRLVRRSPGPDEVRWDPERGEVDVAALEGVDVVVHLAGENVGQRWTPVVKERVLASRVKGTETIADAVARMRRPPRALVCASAIGFYGDRAAPVDETSPPGQGFLPEVCAAWESAADPARAAGVPTSHLRIGVVLTPRGGALERLLPPFRAGAGGVVGSGRQGFSWVALDDVLGAIHFAGTRSLSGPFNVTAPNPTDNAGFTRALGAALGRPTVFPLPAFAVKAVFGEMGEQVLLEGAKVLPRRLLEAGYRFAFNELDGLLRFELGR